MDLFAALDIATGRVHTQLHSHHRAIEFKRFLNHLDRQVPDEFGVHLILDTTDPQDPRHPPLAHPPPPVRAALHPTSSSWLNLVGRWFAALTTKKLRRASHAWVARLRSDITAWVDAWNTDPQPCQWVKTADEIDSIDSYLQRISDSGH